MRIRALGIRIRRLIQSRKRRANENLKKRIDVNQSNLTEEFFYDALNRLDYSRLNGVTNLDLTLNAIGNITAKTSATNPAENVGTYTYHATKKHAVASTSNGWSFGYDANGNMNSYKGNSISWYSYNLPSTINGAGQSSQFAYGPNRNRWRQIASYPSGTETTIYVGGILEKVTVPSGTAWRHYIGAGSAKVIYTRWSTGTINTKYVTSDHLGSSTAVMDDAGAALVNLSFGSFGARRGSAWSGTPSAGEWTQISNSTRHGFTSHEQLDSVNFVHMNGRVFEPVLGRFISADPFMPGSLGSQAQNRYAYVGNRPQSLIDPSGFWARNGGMAMKQWIEQNGFLDFQEIAINRAWAAWGGVRNVSDGLEGTHAGLLSHSMDVLARGGAVNGTSVTAANVVGGSGSAGRNFVNGIFAASAARNAQQSLAGTNTSSGNGGIPQMSDIIVTNSRIGPSERYSWTPGRVTPNAPGLGGTGSLTIGMQPARYNSGSSPSNETPLSTANGTGSSYWSTVPLPLQVTAGTTVVGGTAGYLVGAGYGLKLLTVSGGGNLILAVATASDVGGLALVGMTAGLGLGVTTGLVFTGGYLVGTEMYNRWADLYY